MKKQEGFSLVELLVVVIIIAIVAAIAIPNLLASRRAANEASAISSLRTIHSAQATYQATLGGNVTYAADLAALGDGGSSGGGPKLIDGALQSGSKSGYDFVVAGADNIYCGSAEASTQDTTGVRSFAVSEPGVIYQYAAAGGAAACASTGVLTQGAGTAIQ